MRSGYEFQVAMSFADEDRDYVRGVVKALQARGVRVYYDLDHTVELWGTDLLVHVDDLYRRRSEFVVIFVSRHYVSKQWSRQELRSALARASDEKHEYVLPARLDESDVPGLPPTIQHVDCRDVPPEDLAAMIHLKVDPSGGLSREAARASERDDDEPWSSCRDTQPLTVPSGGLEWTVAAMNVLADSVTNVLALPYAFMPVRVINWVVNGSASDDVHHAARVASLTSAAPPQTVASLLSGLEPDLACRVLARMHSSRARSVWSSMSGRSKRAVLEAAERRRLALDAPDTGSGEPRSN